MPNPELIEKKLKLAEIKGMVEAQKILRFEPVLGVNAAIELKIAALRKEAEALG